MNHPLIDTVLDAYHELRTASDRSPANERITRSLSRLVADVSRHRRDGGAAAGICDHPSIERIQRRLHGYLAEAECEMERFEARRLSRAPAVAISDLRSFRYWSNYRSLVKAELACLRPHLAPERPIAFVGSGPLPISALLLHAATGLPVTCVDADREAAYWSRRLARAIGAPGLTTAESAGEALDYGPFQCVFVASLVDGKEAVIERVLDSAPDALLAVRTAEGIYELLYEPLDPGLCERLELERLASTEADERMINTTYLLRSRRVECEPTLEWAGRPSVHA